MRSDTTQSHFQEEETCTIACGVGVQVMGPGGCCTARSVLAYKLRAADDAVIDLYSEMSDIYAGDLNPQCACMTHSNVAVQLLHVHCTAVPPVDTFL